MSAIRRACIFGGTHGNELSGVYLLKKWNKNPEAIKRSSFETKALMTNPEAVTLNRRYKDCDLNRQFAPDTLACELTPSTPHEVRRAKEIHAMLQKGGAIGPCDVVLDLHNTTSNMKVTLLYRDSPTNVIQPQMIRYIMDRLPQHTCFPYAIENMAPCDSKTLAPNGFSIEVGPQPQGVLRSDIFILQEQVVMHALDFIESYNTGEEFSETEIPIYKWLKFVPYPRDTDRNITAMVHPKLQDQDWKPLSPDSPVFLRLDGETLSLKDILPEYSSFAEPVYPAFINEGAYYEKDIAFMLTSKLMRQVPKLKRDC